MATETDEIRLLINAQTASFDAAMKRVNKQLNNVDKNSIKANNALKTFVAQFATTAAIVAFSKKLVEAGSAMQSLEFRLKATAGSVEAANDAMAFITKTAEQQNINIMSLADGYTRLLPAVNTNKISMEEMREILRLTNDNIKAFGGSASEAAGVFLGLSQTLTSGTVTMEDLRQVTDRMPGTFDRIATSMGLSSAELRKLVSTGELTTDLLKGPLLSALKANEGAAESMSGTYESATTRISNAFLQLGDSSGAVDLATEAMADFASLLESEAFDKTLQVLVIAVGGIGEAFTIAGDTISAAADKVRNSLGIYEDVPQTTGIDQWRDKTVGQIRGAGEAINQVADEVASNIDPKLQALIDKTFGTGEDSEEDNEKQQEKLERFRQSLMTERELELANFEQRLNDLNMFHEQKRISDEEFNSLAKDEFARHQSELTDIQKREEENRKKWSQMNEMQRGKAIFGELDKITAGVSQHSRALFEINKVAGIANAILNTYESITKTMAAYPFPVNVALAGVTAAAGFAQVAAIRSTQFSGSGGSAAPSLSGSTAASPVSNVSNEQASQRTVNVTLNGNNGFTSEQVSGLIGMINDELDDGANLRVRVG